MATKPINRKTADTGPKKAVKKRAPKARVAKAPLADALSATIFTMAGKEAGTIALPAAVFGAPWRADLVHQVTTALAANLRQNRAHTKNRAEVKGGGKKPWKQKGTGQARHGSSRSPIWRHGGVTFGPRTERDYHEKINRRMKSEALRSVLSRKAKEGELIFVDSFAFGAPKTKEAIAALAALSKATHSKLLAKGKNTALIALGGYDANAMKSFRNLGSIATEEVRNLNPLSLLSYKYLVIEKPETALKTLVERTK